LQLLLLFVNHVRPELQLCDPEILLEQYEYNPYTGGQLFSAKACVRQCGQMLHQCAAKIKDMACFCGQRPQGMDKHVHICSDGFIIFDCSFMAEENIGLKLELQQSVPGLVGGSRTVLINYETLNGTKPDLTQMKLEMNLRPESDWYPLKTAATSFNFISPKPGQQYVAFRLKGPTGNEIGKSLLQISINRTVATRGINFVCPKAVLVETYVSCSLSLAAADEVRGKVSWDGLFTQDFTMPGKRFDYIGTSTPYPGPSIPNCHVPSSTILSGTQAMYNGEVKEVFVTLKRPTALKLFVTSVATSSVGLQAFPLPSPWHIKVGDRLGIWGESSGAFDCTRKTKYAPADLTVVGPVEIRIGELLGTFQRQEDKRFLVSVLISACVQSHQNGRYWK
uniref:Apple domain-containing protein n=1 Tax=Schistocephalus solidus TaxID=70667 RepID=A0A183TEN2_SCHSO